MPDADALVKANEVRIGGARVGVVKSVVPVQLKNGEVEAELTLSLDKSAEPIPNDSTILVRPKSPLGLKYLQITPGTSKVGFKAGETIPVRYAKPEPGDIDKFFDMFNDADPQSDPAQPGRLRQRARRARAAAERSDRGAARPGRRRRAGGGQPGRAEHQLRRLLHARSRRSRRRSPRWPSSRRACSSSSTRPSPPSPTSPPPTSQETIEKGPPTLETVNAGLPQINPFLHDTARFFTALQPGAKALPETSPVIAESLHAGVPALNASPVLNNQLLPTAEALLAFQEAEGDDDRPAAAHRPEQEPRTAAPLHHPGADDLQLLHAHLPRDRQRLQPGQQVRQLAELHLLRRRRKARTASPARPRRRPTAATAKRRTTSTTTRCPNTAAPGPAARLRSRQREIRRRARP